MSKFDFDNNFDIIDNNDKHCVIKKYISIFDSEENDKETTTKHVFSDPSNNRLEIVLAKVVVLNEFYSTHLNSNPPQKISKDKTYHMDVVSMANHILSWKEFDKYCKSNDKLKRQKAIRYIRCGESDFRKPYHKDAYSFATKYCSWHNPSDYPIVDSYSKGMIYYLNREFGFYDKKLFQKDLKDYNVFCDAYDALQKYLEKRGKQYSYREMDKFLWYYGKDHGIAL